MQIRRALPGDAEALTNVFMQSKAYWGYDEAFMQRMAALFAVSADYIHEHPVYLLEDDGRPVAFYGFKVIDDEFFLNDMFVLPAYIGKGMGRLLWAHAVSVAQDLGHSYFLIESDPNAEAFYLAMGARNIGTIRSESGRDNPFLRYDLLV